MNPNFRTGLWRLADPKISLASMASLFLGAACAASTGEIHWPWLALTVAGIFFIEVAKNASGEVFDFDSGTDQAIVEADRSPFSGGKRVLVDGLLSRNETWAIAITCYLLALASGLVIASFREPGILVLGLFGMAAAYLYHAPPFRLSYRGFGELAVGLCYGPGICSGTYLVQRGHVDPFVILVSIPLGLLIASFLWINEFPDYEADLSAGKRNCVVLLGRERASRVFAGLLATAGILALILPLLGVPVGALAGLLFLLPATKAGRTLLKSHSVTREIIPAQAQTLFSFLIHALASGTGLILTAR